ncbi:MAG: flagellar type III secretion system pore protein FliP [Candidatus Omnitrophica bacterium]|nr:flagellar type III secretion system pore protein FliP [Candidatus Omnitrophota bacterium]MBD3269146.1 flagellar type III secretion system pore protein FliP [Candidatus Omnitrophota bacterium]
MKKSLKIIFIVAIIMMTSVCVYAQNIPLPSVSLQFGQADSPKEVNLTLQIIFLLTILTLAPAIVIMVTSFTRIVIVLAFVRHALATQQIPPNQVLIALALFLTFFVMAPIINGINEDAFQPYLDGKISQSQALDESLDYLREFMFKQTRPNDLSLFVDLSKSPRPNTLKDVPTSVLIPAFVVSELKTAFQIGFVIFIPFLIIDLVVASTLISMGMLLLPPIIVSFPFKILLFIMVDGWHLITRSLVYSFH